MRCSKWPTSVWPIDLWLSLVSDAYRYAWLDIKCPLQSIALVHCASSLPHEWVDSEHCVLMTLH